MCTRHLCWTRTLKVTDVGSAAGQLTQQRNQPTIKDRLFFPQNTGLKPYQTTGGTELMLSNSPFGGTFTLSSAENIITETTVV